MKYWVGTVSQDHVERGMKLGIAQIGHGKRSGLARMKAGDVLIYYSPKKSLDSTESVQAFTALGTMMDDEIWQADEGYFQPWRRKVAYNLKLHAAPIRPILGLLSFTKDCPSWGYAFRFGLFEITKEDFEIIQQAMSSNV